jgi:phosphoglycolate phosphatase-like HAD superfamily hydrolase
MELTPEQRNIIRQAELRGERRVQVEFTPEQQADYERSVEVELAAKDENIAHFRKTLSAMEQPGFFGDIRRAVQHSRKPINELAAQIGVEPHFLSDFLAGDVELAAPNLDRLIETLGLRLMQEIPR